MQKYEKIMQYAYAFAICISFLNSIYVFSLHQLIYLILCIKNIKIQLLKIDYDILYFVKISK